MARVWHRGFLEGLFVRGLGARLTPAHREQLARLGLPVDRLREASSDEVLLEALRLVGPLVAPDAPFERQQHQLGVQAVVGYFDTSLGYLFSAALQLSGPARGVRHLDRNLRMLTNSLHATVLEQGASEAVVEVQPVGALAHFVVGVLDGSGSLARDGKAGAHLVALEGERCQVRLFW